MIFNKIPLAWFQITHEKIRLLVALIGVSFAGILMFIQLGFQTSLYDSAIRLHKTLQGEIVLISSQTIAFAGIKTFSQRYIYQALSVEDVASVSPIYLTNTGAWKNPQTHVTRNIRVIGFPPDDLVFNLKEVQQNQVKLKIPDAVLFDRGSRTEYGLVVDEFSQSKAMITQVNNYKIKVVGLFELGTSFGADGNIITSDLNFIRLFTNQREGAINIGLIKLKHKANTEKVLGKLRQYLPAGIQALSMREFEELEKNYWKKSTAIGFIFTVGTAMAFIVGTVIVYQILYTDVSNHLVEYATLKAIGYTDTYMVKVVFQEALILAILGYIPGFILTLGLYALTKAATLLPIGMSASRALLVLVLTILMCFISGFIAVNKLRSADPADVF